MKQESLDQQTPEKRIKIKRSDGTSEYVTAKELAALNQKNKAKRELQNLYRNNRRLKLILMFSWIFFLGVTAFYYTSYHNIDDSTVKKPAHTISSGGINGLNEVAQNTTPAVKNTSYAEGAEGAEKNEITSIDSAEPLVPVGISGPAEPALITFHEQDLVQAVLAWARAWSARDIGQYLTFYSQRFSPENNQVSYPQWADNRRVRLETPDWITVDITDIEISGPHESGDVTARFRQNYLTNSYQDQTLKELIFTRENNNWLILRETSIKQLPQQPY
jgi:hypothetical protein